MYLSDQISCTPDGVKSVSSIINSICRRYLILDLLLGTQYSSSFAGEAVFVDLRNLILTLTRFASF
jgi:hypothetical protein